MVRDCKCINKVSRIYRSVARKAFSHRFFPGTPSPLAPPSSPSVGCRIAAREPCTRTCTAAGALRADSLLSPVSLKHRIGSLQKKVEEPFRFTTLPLQPSGIDSSLPCVSRTNSPRRAILPLLLSSVSSSDDRLWVPCVDALSPPSTTVVISASKPIQQ